MSSTEHELLCPVLIGRDGELTGLHHAMAEAGQSRGSVTFLMGEAGIGKSRLARELVDAARRDELPVLLGRATPSSSTVAFRPLVEALFSHFRDEDLPDVPELEPFRGSLSRLVPQWQREDASAESSIVLLAEAMVRLLRLIGRGGGCLLVLEDLHWADPETLSIVEYLCENLQSEPVLLLCTVRSEEPSSAVGLVDLLAARRAAVVANLRRLEPADAVAMACACIKAGELPSAVEALVTGSADGLPFFVEELLAGAVDAGVLVQEDSRWTVHGQVVPQLPRTFVDSVNRRLDSLGDGQVLVTAAVLGRRFEWSLLCEVTGEPEDVVLRALRAGVEAQLLVSDPTSPGSFQFRHALTVDAVVARLLPPEGAAIARKGLDAIEGAHPGLPGEWCDLGARLAERAGDARAATLLVESGRRSLAGGALASAEDALVRAYALTEEPQVRADLLETLCIVLASAGKVDATLEVGERLVTALHVVAAGFARIGLAHLRLASAAAGATRWEEAERHLARARRHIGKADDHPLAARVDVIAAEIAYGRGDLPRAEELARGALAQGQELELPDLVCEALGLIGRCARVTDPDLAEEMYLEAAAVAEQHGLKLLRARALFETGTIDFLRLRPPDRLLAARELASSMGALALVAQIDLHVAVSALFRFDNDRAIKAAREASSAARRLGMRDLFALPLMAEAAAHGREGRRDRMEELIAEALDSAGDEVGAAAVMWGHCRAELSLIDDQRERAVRELDTQMELLRALATSPPLPQRGLWALVRAVGDRDAEAACAEVRESGATALQLNLGLVRYAEAVNAGRSGRAEEAQDAVIEADGLLATVPWYHHLGRRLVAEAAIADNWGDPATWLRGAMAQFERHGQERLAASCRSLLRRAGSPVPRQRTESTSVVPVALRELGVTGREHEVLALLAEGLSNKEIAARLFLSPRTVERHIANLFVKTDLASRTALAAYAARIDRS